MLLSNFRDSAAILYRLGLVRDVQLNEGAAQIAIEITTANPEVPGKIEDDVRAAISALDGIERVDVQMTVNPHQNQQQPSGNSADGGNPLQQVKFAVAVASGKGGVGKSTITVNLACALQNPSQRGWKSRRWDYGL